MHCAAEERLEKVIVINNKNCILLPYLSTTECTACVMSQLKTFW